MSLECIECLLPSLSSINYCEDWKNVINYCFILGSFVSQDNPAFSFLYYFWKLLLPCFSVDISIQEIILCDSLEVVLVSNLYESQNIAVQQADITLCYLA